MARTPKVDHVRKSFLTEIEYAENLFTAIDALPRKTRHTVQTGIHPKHVRQVAELAFMGIIAAWEEFLERSLVRYLAGAKTDSGYAPSHKYGVGSRISSWLRGAITPNSLVPGMVGRRSTVVDGEAGCLSQ